MPAPNEKDNRIRRNQTYRTTENEKNLTTDISTKQGNNSSSTVSMNNENEPVKPKKPSTGRWTEEEHRLFLEGLELFPYRAWKKIATLIETRTVVQIRTHAQKYYQKLAREEEMKAMQSQNQLGSEDDGINTELNGLNTTITKLNTSSKKLGTRGRKRKVKLPNQIIKRQTSFEHDYDSDEENIANFPNPKMGTKIKKKVVALKHKASLNDYDKHYSDGDDEEDSDVHLLNKPVLSTNSVVDSHFPILGNLHLDSQDPLDFESNPSHLTDDLTFLQMSPMIHDVSDLSDEESLKWFSSEETTLTKPNDYFDNLSNPSTASTSRSSSMDFNHSDSSYSISSQSSNENLSTSPINVRFASMCNTNDLSTETNMKYIDVSSDVGVWDDIYPSKEMDTGTNQHHGIVPVVLDPEIFVSDFFTNSNDVNLKMDGISSATITTTTTALSTSSNDFSKDIHLMEEHQSIDPHPNKKHSNYHVYSKIQDPNVEEKDMKNLKDETKQNSNHMKTISNNLVPNLMKTHKNMNTDHHFKHVSSNKTYINSSSDCILN